MRDALLQFDPDIDPVTMPALVGIADRIERESVRRYATLEDLMARRGEIATAAAFRFLLNEELHHVDAVGRWAAHLGEPVPEVGAFAWHLPADLSSSWDDVAGSALLTPYRAFAIAVENEQRAFELYSYLSAHAGEASVAVEAERLAHEELRHASLMRRWRRQAWHRERRGAPEAPASSLETTDALHGLLERHEADIAARHRAIAARLRAIGDLDSAELLEQLRGESSRPVSDDAARAQDIAPGDNPVHLLVAAQEPLEAFSETLEAVTGSLEGALFEEAAAALGSVVRRLGRIALRIAALLQNPGDGAASSP